MIGPDPGRRPPLSRGQALRGSPEDGLAPQGDGLDGRVVRYDQLTP